MAGLRPFETVKTEFAGIGDTVEVEVNLPYPQTHRLTLLTPQAVAFANKLLSRPRTPWRKVGNSGAV